MWGDLVGLDLFQLPLLIPVVFETFIFSLRLHCDYNIAESHPYIVSWTRFPCPVSENLSEVAEDPESPRGMPWHVGTKALVTSPGINLASLPVLMRAQSVYSYLLVCLH